MPEGESTYWGYFSTTITDKQNTDTGMAMVLILLLIGFFSEEVIYFKLSIPLLLINMIYPRLFYPIAVLWFGISSILGTIMSAVILTVIYFTLVTPVGLFRKFVGKDSLSLKKFKESQESVLVDRNHTYTSQDLEKPY